MISAVSNRYYPQAATYNKRCKTQGVNKNNQTSFGAGLSDAQTEKVLKMLKEKVSDIKFIKDLSELPNITGNLLKKYKAYGINSVGAMLIPERYLEEFVSKETYGSLEPYSALCVGVGDKHGPVETWTKAYQSIVVLFPKISQPKLN